jgi:hypothetical protein
MSSSRHFIKSSVADLQKEIDAELFLWLTGKKSPGVAFSGSKRDVFWGLHLDEIVAKITDEAFKTAHSIAEKYDINPIDAARDAGEVAEDAVRATLEKMADFDRRMRGKGFPMTVAPKTTSLELERSVRFIVTRRDAEVALLTESMQNRKRTSEPNTKGGTVNIISAGDTVVHGDIRGGDGVGTSEAKRSLVPKWIATVVVTAVAALIVAYLKGCFPNLLK